MNMPPSDHTVWSIVRMAVAGLLFIGIAAVGYRNPVSGDDVLPVLGMILGIGSFDKVKQLITKSGEETR